MRAAPLTSSVTHILLALAQQDLHGYGIMREVVSLSGGDYKIGPGTLYANLRTLLTNGLVTEFQEAVEIGEPRRVFHLTKTGAAALEGELERLQGLVRAGRQRFAASRAGSA